MKTFSLYTHYKKILADTITPVSIYLKIRDKFPNSILLESSDYHANDNSFSYICCNPIASIKVEDGIISQTYPDGSSKTNNASTVGVLGHIEHPPADENTPYQPGDIYQQTKMEGELIALDYFRSGKISGNVIRPGMVYGPGDMRTLKLFSMISKGTFFYVGQGEATVHFV